jgi:hypothetical protein
MTSDREIEYNYFWIATFDEEGFKLAFEKDSSEMMNRIRIVTTGSHLDSMLDNFRSNSLPSTKSFTLNQFGKSDSRFVTTIINCNGEELSKIQQAMKPTGGPPPSTLKPHGAEFMSHYTLACTARLV